MVYGQGVSPNETVPYYLEQHLNEAVKASLFQVINCGVSGFNIWNSLTSLRNIPQFYDAVVLILCVNDAELFGRTFRLEYPHGATTWQPQTASYQLVRTALQEMKNWLDEKHLPLTVGYYTIWDIQHEAEATDILRDLCDGLNIPFLDFFSYFHNRRLRQSDLQASRFDFHPSRLAHDAAARHIVRSVQHRWTEFFHSERAAQEVARDILAIMKAIDVEGLAPDVVFRWGYDVLSSKNKIFARSISENERDAFASASKDTRKAIDASYVEWRRCVRSQAFVDHWFSRESPLAGRLWLTDEGIMRAEELMLAMKLSDGAGLEDVFSRLPPVTNVPKSHDLISMQEEISRSTEALGRLQEIEDELRNDENPARLLKLAGVRQDAMIALSHLRTIADQFSRQRRLWEEKVQTFLASEKSGVEGTGQLTTRAEQALREAALHLVSSCADVDYVLKDGNAEPELFTTVSVSVRTFQLPNEKPVMLDIYVDSLAPHRIVTKDGMYVGFDGGVVVVTLKFPIFFFGRVTISMDTPNRSLQGKRASFIKLEVYNDPSRRVTLTSTDFHRSSKGDLIFPFVLVP
jgi:hypothetical protein